MERVTKQLFIGFAAGILWGVLINTVIWRNPGPTLIQWCEAHIELEGGE